MKKKHKFIYATFLPLIICISSCGLLSSFFTEGTSSDTQNNENKTGEQTDNKTGDDTTKDNDNKDDNSGNKEDSGNKDNTQEVDESDDTEREDETILDPKDIIIREEEPTIKSNKYHEGFDKKIYSSLFPYQPIIRQELPKLSIDTPDGSNDYAKANLYSMDTIYSARKNNTIKYLDCTISLSNCESTFSFENISGQVKLRGNASCYSYKKGLSLKFNEKRNLLGLNNNAKFKKYVLDPLYYDATLLKESTALYLGKQMFNYDNLFTSDTTPILLYLNGEYWGIYLLKEKIQVGKNRVNIDDIEKREPAGEYTGIDTGFLFEYDGYGLLEEQYQLSPVFRIDYNNNAPLRTLEGKTTYQAHDTYMNYGKMVNEFTLKSDIYSQDQLNFLSSYVGNVYKIMYEAVYNKKYYVFNSDYSDIVLKTNLTSKDVIKKVVDIDSFVDMYLLQEMCCNNDMYWGSQFFQLDMSNKGNKKLTFSSAWDYDWGLGRGKTMNSTHLPGDKVDTLYAAYQFDDSYTNAWYLILIHEDWYMDLVKEKWKLLVDHGVLYNALHYIDEYSLLLENYYEENFKKWVFELWGNEVDEYAENYDNQPKQAKYLFKWLAGKFNYLNTVFGDGTKLFNF